MNVEEWKKQTEALNKIQKDRGVNTGVTVGTSRILLGA